jgi:hypothetical protein
VPHAQRARGKQREVLWGTGQLQLRRLQVGGGPRGGASRLWIPCVVLSGLVGPTGSLPMRCLFRLWSCHGVEESAAAPAVPTPHQEYHPRVISIRTEILT